MAEIAWSLVWGWTATLTAGFMVGTWLVEELCCLLGLNNLEWEGEDVV